MEVILILVLIEVFFQPTGDQYCNTSKRRKRNAIDEHVADSKIGAHHGSLSKSSTGSSIPKVFTKFFKYLRNQCD